MAFELLGLSILAIVAIILFIAGLGVIKVHPVIGFLAGIGALFIFLGVMLSAFGGVGFIDNILTNSWVRYLLVGSASYVIGSFVALLF